MKNPHLNKVKTALQEVMSRPHLFGDETYTQIVLALNEKMRALQTSNGTATLPTSDEIRLVTVMFVDVKDSTEITRRLGGEAWKNLIARIHRQQANLVEQWGGQVGQFLGDGMLCFFGAQHSTENDAERATRCALAIQVANDEYAKQINREHNLTFALRIGISTGKVLVGMIGAAEREELTALGATTNLAARLQTVCPPGEVVIDTQTYYRVRSHFVTTANPPATLKGFDVPVDYFTVKHAKTNSLTQLTTETVEGLHLPFVGRAAELQQLRDLMTDVLDNRKRSVFVFGDIGVGKSRFLQQVAEVAQELGFYVLTVAAPTDRQAVSYSLIHSLLVRQCEMNDNPPPSVAEERVLSYMRDLWQESGDAEMAAALIGYAAGVGFTDSQHVMSVFRSGGDGQRMLFAWVTMWIKSLAEGKPLLLVVDNLQWMDEISVKCLSFIAKNFRDEPLLTICAARTPFREDHPRYLSLLPSHQEIELTALDRETTLELINTILEPLGNMPKNVPITISERAEGNPLFVEEILRMLFINGTLSTDSDGRVHFDYFRFEVEETALPTSLTGLVQARLDDLDVTARRVVQLAAVVGQVFWEGAVTDMAGAAVSAELQELVSKGIVLKRRQSGLPDEDEYSFRIGLYREVAYGSLTQADRIQYHRQTAKWLRQHIDRRPDYLDLLASHEEAGALLQDALQTYAAAVDDYMRRSKLVEVLKLIERGLAVTKHIPREAALPVACKLWMVQGLALNALDRYGEASTASSTAIMLMDELPEGMMQVERSVAGRALGDAFRNLGEYDEALEALHETYELLPEDDPKQLTATLRAFGHLLWTVGNLEESLAYQRRALALAEAMNDQRQVSAARSILGNIEFDRGNLADALELYQMVYDANARNGNLYFQIKDLCTIGEVYLALFAYDAALESFNQADDLQQSLRYTDPRLTSKRGLCLVAMGDASGFDWLQPSTGDNRDNPMVQQQRDLDAVIAHAIYGDHERLHEKAAVVVQGVNPENPVLRGRALLWLGIAQYLNHVPDAEETLQQALRLEATYGGRELWLCHEMLAHVVDNAEGARSHRNAARTHLQFTADKLKHRPELAQSLLNNQFVATLLKYHSSSN